MKDKLISLEDIKKVHPIFRGKYGDFFAKKGRQISGLDNVNKVYDHSKHLRGVDFCTHLLDNLQINRIVRNEEILEKYKDQPFITVANHAYGHVDGIANIELVGKHQPKFKLMVNFILGMIETLSDNFITVNPYDADVFNQVSNLSGIKGCIAQLQEGNPLGLFPAGAISNLVLNNGKWMIEDREWQPSVLKLIKFAKVPVIPIHISGRNSSFFYMLGLIDWRLRNLRLGHELYNKKGHEMIFTVGEPISPKEQAKHTELESFGNFLKTKTYELRKSK
ncbi:MAG: 1-acyl-sn-glycerol-3-phosphate acyltransferase [Dysgonamonadaceae bacterium]|jgi:putative hemolysin|nr:1-acyl-sn-glycerol-3-phosphate acyltransferase [Dysgonamonadaceae bacterium]